MPSMGRMMALVVVEGDPAPDADTSLRSLFTSMQIDAFILHGLPQPLDEDVVDAELFSSSPADVRSWLTLPSDCLGAA